MSLIESREKEFYQEFELFNDWKERYEFIIDLGDEIEEMPSELKVEANKIQGCASNLWLYAKLEETGRMKFWAESDSLFVKGMIALVLKIYDGVSPQEIVDSQTNFLIDSDLVQNLSPNRINGVGSVVSKIKEYAQKAL